MKTRLRVLRAERHWSQAELATRVGVARATIVSIETRKYDPGLALAFKIARAFCKTIEEVFLYEAQQVGPDGPLETLKGHGAEPSGTLR